MAPITSCASRSSCSSAIEIVVPKKLCCWREYAKHFASTIGLARATSRLDAIAATASSNESPRESTRFPSINPAASTLNPRNGAMAIPLAKSGPQRPPGAHFGPWTCPCSKLVPRGHGLALLLYVHLGAMLHHFLTESGENIWVVKISHLQDNLVNMDPYLTELFQVPCHVLMGRS